MIQRAIALLYLLLFSFVSYSREKAYTIVNYNTDNGLPQNSITGIQFDRKGYCWLGTQMGLVRFDGQRFSVFGSDNITGLRSDRISLTTDKAGNILAGTGGIYNVLRIDDRASQRASQPVLIAQPDVEIPDQGLAVPLSFIKRVSRDTALQIEYGTSTSNLYIVRSGDGYYITPRQTIKFSPGSAPNYQNVLVLDESLILLQTDGRTTVWTNGIIQKPPKQEGPLWHDPDFRKGNFAALNTHGNYVYAGKNLYRLRFDHNVLSSELQLEGIDIPGISCVCFDPQNNKWYIGSRVSGLFVVSLTDFYTPPTPDFVNQAFHGQVLTEEGILNQNILYRRDGSSKKYPIRRQVKPVWYSRENKSLYYAPRLMLERADLATGKTKPIVALASHLSSIYPDPQHKDTLIFSSSFSIGKIARDTLLLEKKIPGIGEGAELFASYPQGNDTFLLATWSGVKWYDFRHNRLFKSILDSLTIRQLYAEQPNRIWIASYSKGWYLYDNGRVCRLPDGPFSALKTVNAIIDDGRGYFWLSSNNGLYKVNKQALLNYAAGKSEEVFFYTFTTKDHLPTNEFNAANPSYVWLPDSMLSLPSIKGLVWFYPHQIKLSLPSQGIYLEHVFIDEHEKSMESPLVLKPDHGRLRLLISSPYFGNPANMQLQFKLKGLEDEWHPVPVSGEIILDRIPSGSFPLIIRKISGMEPGAYTELVLPIRVRPFWYHTTTFYLLLGCVLMVLVYWIIILRTRILELRNRKLKMQVTLQTRDLHRVVNRLKQSEEALKQSNQTKNNIITTVLHDLRSPIRFLHTISKWVAKDHTQMQPQTLQEHLEELKNSTASLNSFTDQFFTWALSQHDTFSASYSRVELHLLFKRIETLYAGIVQTNGNQLVVMPTDIVFETDPDLLQTVVRNLLDNANKNTRNGNLSLAAYCTEENIVITVTDTGKGFDAESLRLFLDKTKTDRRNGNGSFIMLQLLDLIEGKIVADSEPGKGTTFYIMIPHQNEARDSKPADSALPPIEPSVSEKPGL